jgi:hypothetical protein
MTFLSPAERLAVSQLRGYGYAAISAVFEAGILPFVMEQLRGRPSAGLDEVRALLRFADEEAKHIQLFEDYAQAFEAQTGVKPAVAPTREQSIAATARNHPLTTALMSAHIEWMTQTHYLQAIKTDDAMDPTSVRVLTYHYIEEVQHGKIDELLIETIAGLCSGDEILEAIEGYEISCTLIGALLQAQAELDVETLAALTSRQLRGAERDRFVDIQHGACVETMLGAGREHPRVKAAVERLRARVAGAQHVAAA